MDLTLKETCIECGTLHYIKMEKKSYDAWKSGVSIQNVAPSLSVDERELLLSGFCGKCYDKLMPEPEENLTFEQELMRDFLLELAALEEQVDGSDILTRTFSELSINVEQFKSLKEIAEKVHEAYHDFYADQVAEGPIPEEFMKFIQKKP